MAEHFMDEVLIQIHPIELVSKITEFKLKTTKLEYVAELFPSNYYNAD